MAKTHPSQQADPIEPVALRVPHYLLTINCIVILLARQRLRQLKVLALALITIRIDAAVYFLIKDALQLVTVLVMATPNTVIAYESKDAKRGMPGKPETPGDGLSETRATLINQLNSP